MIKQIDEIWSGLTLACVVGTASWWMAGFAPYIGGVTIAILLGILVGNIVPTAGRFNAGIRFAESRLLPLSIVLLGVELQLTALADLGVIAIVVIVATIAISMIVSVQLGQMLGYSRKFSILLGAGNGICGSSAIAATGLAIEANEEDTGISISVVNLIGTLGIFLLPSIVHAFSLQDSQGGLLIGGTLQAVGQVVAAGYSVNDAVGSIALVVKMGRVLLLGPMVVLIYSLMVRGSDTANAKRAIRVPAFIIGFFVVSVVGSIGVFSPSVTDLLKTMGKYLLVIAMAGIGMRIQLRMLFRSAPRALLFGLMVSFTQIVMTLLLIAL